MNSINPLKNHANLASIVLGILLIPAILLVTAGCTSLPVGGPAESSIPPTTIGKILEQPGAFNGTSVAVRGTITIECASGCWFLLKDETGTIYVTLSQDNFAIPAMQGQTVTAEGKVSVVNGDVTLHAYRVITGSGIYP